LHIVAKKYGLRLAQLLLSRGAKVNTRTLSHQTPLHYLVRYHEPHDELVPILEMLLGHGADPNARSSFHTTALMYAKERGNLQVIKALKEHGAIESPEDILQPLGKQVLEYMIEDELDQWMDLLKTGFFSNFSDLKPLDTRYLHKGYPIVMMAADSKNKRYAELLIAAGFDASRCSTCESALHYACQFSNPSKPDEFELFKPLLQGSQEIDAPCNNKTPLLIACQRTGAVFEIPQLLLDHGANINKECGEYGSALNGALQLPGLSIGDYLIAKCLLGRGAILGQEALDQLERLAGQCYRHYGGPGQRSPDYSAFGQITGLCPCQLQAPKATWLAWQRAVQGVIPIFIVGLSVYALF
jgi:ankyrin repeat protein